jgi:hypothetical protein
MNLSTTAAAERQLAFYPWRGVIPGQPAGPDLRQVRHGARIQAPC